MLTLNPTLRQSYNRVLRRINANAQAIEPDTTDDPDYARFLASEALQDALTHLQRAQRLLASTHDTRAQNRIDHFVREIGAEVRRDL